MNLSGIYYRPIWTCGRYNEKAQTAIYYNLIAGMSYFFESYSAMVIGEVLSVPRNGMMELEVIFPISCWRTGHRNQSIRNTIVESKRLERMK